MRYERGGRGERVSTGFSRLLRIFDVFRTQARVRMVGTGREGAETERERETGREEKRAIM